MAVVVLLGAGLAGCTGEDLGGGTGSGAGSDAVPKGSALKAVDELAVKGRAPKTGYARNEFGAAWVDTDHNGCDTRVISMLRAVACPFSQRMQDVVGCAY